LPNTGTELECLIHKITYFGCGWRYYCDVSLKEKCCEIYARTLGRKLHNDQDQALR
jgi:hypothetical protein